MTDATKKRPEAISKDTKVTIGFAMAVFAGVLWSLNQQYAMREEIMTIQRDVLELRNDLRRSESLWSDRWTRSMHAQWATLLAAKNESLDVPMPGPAGR